MIVFAVTLYRLDHILPTIGSAHLTRPIHMHDAAAAGRTTSMGEAVWPLPLSSGVSVTDSVREHAVGMYGDAAACTGTGLCCLRCSAICNGLHRGLRAWTLRVREVAGEHALCVYRTSERTISMQ